MGILKLDNPTVLRRIDLNHEDWDDPTPGQDDVRRELDMEVLDTPDHPVEDAAMTGSHPNKRRRTPTTARSLETWQLIRDDQELHPHWVHCGWCHPRRNLGQRISIPCTSLPRKGKPWDVVGNHHQRRHWTCHHSYAQCNRCFKRYSYPKEWHAEVIQTQGALSEGSLSSLSSGSDTLD